MSHLYLGLPAKFVKNIKHRGRSGNMFDILRFYKHRTFLFFTRTRHSNTGLSG